MTAPSLTLPRERGRGTTVVWLGDPAYPARLREIHDPPARLYINGQLPSEPMIAIVGSRRATPYGRRTAHRLARDLSDAGVVVVSGLARGIDAAAHRGALEGLSPTVAVMATGLDRIYPPEHTELAQAIAASGAVITEAENGTLPLPGRFPVRNRIISGLSLGVVVVEAAERSGALITARMLPSGRRTAPTRSDMPAIHSRAVVLAFSIVPVLVTMFATWPRLLTTRDIA